MKKIYFIFSVFAIVYIACETDFDVNNTWEEVVVVYGLLDAGEGKELQQIKISKAFLGNMDALQMAQYADSINLDTNDLDVRIFRIKNNNTIDTVVLSAAEIIREGDLFVTTNNNVFKEVKPTSGSTIQYMRSTGYSFSNILLYNVPFTIWFARDFGMRMFLQNFGYFLKLNIKSTGGICAEIIRIIKRISCGQPKYW